MINNNRYIIIVTVVVGENYVDNMMKALQARRGTATRVVDNQQQTWRGNVENKLSTMYQQLMCVEMWITWRSGG